MSEFSRRSFLRTTAAAGLALPAAAHPLGGQTIDRPRRTYSRNEDPLGVRGDFPVTDELAYLNTASVGPLPRVVHDALAAYAEEKMMYRNPGSRGQALQEARAKFARVFGANEQEIALLFSTSDAENIITSAIDWRAGDNVVVDELHFTTTFVLYRQLEKEHGIELRIVPSTNGRAPVDDFDSLTDDRTRLVSVAWVSNRNGYKHSLPHLTEMAHSKGAYVYADAIQTFGNSATSLHDEGVDFACGNGYKWLFADFGCAPFYVREEHHDWLKPDRYGHRQVAETLPELHFRLHDTSRQYEYANVSYGSVTALNAALDVISDVGLARIEEHTVALAGELYGELTRLGLRLFTPEDNPSPIVSFYHDLEPEMLATALREAGVAITFQEGGQLVRVAVAMFNNRDDVDRLLGVLSGLV